MDERAPGQAASRLNVFISWSGERSKALASVFSWWLPKVSQAVRLFYSPDDIERGAVWGSALVSELGRDGVGLLCLTPENRSEPWIMFEAGALLNRFGRPRVCLILYDLEPSDLAEPLSLLNAARSEEPQIRQVLAIINAQLADRALEIDVLDEEFSMRWPKLEEPVLSVMQEYGQPAPPPKRSKRELLEEILQYTRLLVAPFPSSGSIVLSQLSGEVPPDRVFTETRTRGRGERGAMARLVEGETSES